MSTAARVGAEDGNHPTDAYPTKAPTLGLDSRASGASFAPKNERSFLGRPAHLQRTHPDQGISEFNIDMISAEQRDRLNKAFEIFDTNGSGKISTAELNCVFQIVGHNPEPGEVEGLVYSIDTNHDGMVDFKEFAAVWWTREKQNIEANWDLELEMCFNMLDLDKSGSLSIAELRETLMTMGTEKLTSAECDEMLAEADLDGSGVVSLSEFKAMKCWAKS